MDEGARCSVRSLRRGRGVRVRGGQRSPIRSLLVAGLMEVEDVVVVADHSGPSGRARGRKGRANTRHVRPEASTIDELVICNIEELPEGRGLETPLHPKRMCKWRPSIPELPPRPPSPPPPPWPSIALPLPASSSVAPPEIIVEIIDVKPIKTSRPATPMQDQSPPSPPTRHFQQFRDKDNINYGSDEDTDESDNEESIAVTMVPKVFRNMMETPLDHDAADEYVAIDSGPAADTTPAGGLVSAHVSPAATERPLGLYDFDWRAFPNPPIPPKSRREIFSEINVGPTIPCVDPYDIFVEIWDRQIMEHIATETNKYAQQVASQMFESNNLHPTSRINQWYDTTPDELYVFFGLILAMGIVVKTRMEEYWGSTADVFCTPGFSAHMRFDRFLLLSKCLHFNDNDDMCALELDYSEARLFKIQPILSHLNRKFQSMYTPAQNIALDESLLMWKGCLEIGQLIPNKASKRGVKTYEICEPQSGYLWRFEIHAHNKSPPQFTDPLEASTPAIVLQLIQGLEHKGYTLWMDNFYQSPCLARRLKCLGFDCVGTLRTDRMFVPQALNKLTKRDMRPGQITGLTSGDLDVMVWRDINRVAMISTYHGNGQQTVRGTTKPILIMDYNIMMGGVDKKDQLLAMYPVERERTKVWYKKLFRRLLNVSVLNSYIIHHHTSSLSHRNFRISLVKSLLAKHCITPSPISLATTQTKADIRHRLAEFPMRTRQRMRRVCTNCKKLVRTFCVGCNKTVCMEPCFLTIHS